MLATAPKTVRAKSDMGTADAAMIVVVMTARVATVVVASAGVVEAADVANIATNINIASIDSRVNQLQGGLETVRLFC